MGVHQAVEWLALANGSDRHAAVPYEHTLLTWLPHHRSAVDPHLGHLWYEKPHLALSLHHLTRVLDREEIGPVPLRSVELLSRDV